mmetsp:Transcript_40330/g.116478  ORF Transcript_40330/g.116478 Transcript_40330/m.116478 type:complete len:131 (-) Transcript_40330:297-689(-)
MQNADAVDGPYAFSHAAQPVHSLAKNSLLASNLQKQLFVQRSLQKNARVVASLAAACHYWRCMCRRALQPGCSGGCPQVVQSAAQQTSFRQKRSHRELHGEDFLHSMHSQSGHGAVGQTCVQRLPSLPPI